MVKSTTVKRPLLKRALEALVIFIVFLVLAVVGFLLFQAIYERPPEDMLKISDQFNPPSSWKLVTSKIEPKRLQCIDVECPSVWKVWDTGSPVTHTELEALLQRSGWNLSISGDCIFDNPNTYGNNNEICSAKGDIGQYELDISVSVSNPAGNNQIRLNIMKKE